MTDPMDALRALQIAMLQGAVGPSQFQRCALHPALLVHMDEPTPGVPRFTYADIATAGRAPVVKAIALFVLIEPIDGVACFQAGYAVTDAERRRGLGSKIFRQGLDEFRHGMGRSGMPAFYLEAIVGADNVASNKIAAKGLRVEPTAIADEIANEPAFQYLSLISSR